MRSRFVAFVAVGAMSGLQAGTAGADTKPVGLEIAVGVGLAAPAGALGAAFQDPGLPLAIDAGLRAKHFFIGSALQYAFLFGCGGVSGGSCHDTDLQVVGEGRFYLLPDGKQDPWFGAGVGYELARDGLSGINYSGWVLDLRTGVDFKWDPADAVSVGPFLSISAGEYLPEAGNSFRGGLHEWFTLGLRAVWDPR